MQMTYVVMFFIYHSFKRMFKIFEFYNLIYGLNLNENKSSIILLSTRTKTTQPLDISCKWFIPSDHKTILGIQVDNLTMTFFLQIRTIFFPSLQI